MLACLSPAGALFTASVDSDAAYVELLISNGMDPNTSDYNQRTPLHLAASNGHVHIVQFLCGQQVMVQFTACRVLELSRGAPACAVGSCCTPALHVPRLPSRGAQPSRKTLPPVKWASKVARRPKCRVSSCGPGRTSVLGSVYVMSGLCAGAASMAAVLRLLELCAVAEFGYSAGHHSGVEDSLGTMVTNLLLLTEQLAAQGALPPEVLPGPLR